MALLEVRNLKVNYGPIQAVRGIDLDVEEGNIVALLGANGAGKTTTTLMLLGLTEPSEGQAWIDGKDCTRDPIAIKRMVGYLPDNVGFYADMTGRENLRFTGQLNGLPRDLAEARIDDLLQKVGMTEAADQKTGTYSRGMRQRLGIADVLMKDPSVVIMDEPTLGIDPEGMRELMDLIRALAVEEGRTILISSHQLYQIQQICDRVGLFVNGRLIACGRIDELAAQTSQEGRYVLETSAIPNDAGYGELLKSLSNVERVERKGDYFMVESRWDIRRELSRRAVDAGYTIAHLRRRGDDLDEIYRRYFEKGDEKNDEGNTGKNKGFLSRYRKER